MTLITFILTFTAIGAVSAAACGYLSFEPVRFSRRGLAYRDIKARRAQTAASAFIGAVSALILALLVVSVAITNGVQL